jgi:hypothetical protein
MATDRYQLVSTASSPGSINSNKSPNESVSVRTKATSEPASKAATPSRGACRDGTGKEETEAEKPWQRPTFVGGLLGHLFLYAHRCVVLPPQLTGQTIHSAKKTQRILVRSEICSPSSSFYFKRKCPKTTTSPSETFRANVRRAVDRSPSGKSHKNRMVTMRRCKFIYKYAQPGRISSSNYSQHQHFLRIVNEI